MAKQRTRSARNSQVQRTRLTAGGHGVANWKDWNLAVIISKFLQPHGLSIALEAALYMFPSLGPQTEAGRSQSAFSKSLRVGQFSTASEQLETLDCHGKLHLVRSDDTISPGVQEEMLALFEKMRAAGFQFQSPKHIDRSSTFEPLHFGTWHSIPKKMTERTNPILTQSGAGANSSCHPRTERKIQQ